MKSLEDRIASLELQLLSHGIPCVETMPTDATPDLSGIDTGQMPHGISDQTHDVVAQIALDSLQENSFSRRISNQSGVSLLQSLMSGPMTSAFGLERKSDHHSLLDELPYEMRARIPPRDAARRLADAYFEHCDFFSPLIASKETFLSTIEPLYAEHGAVEQTTLVKSRFRALLVFATAVLLLNRTDSSVPASRSEGYYATAIHVLSQNADMICTGDLDHILNLLLVVQYSCFSANLAAAWHFSGLVTRLAVELNLHNEPTIASRLTSTEINERRWLFWTMYILERNLCVITGRPFSIPDEAISTPLPVPPENNSLRTVAIHLIKLRRLESETYTTLGQKNPANGAILDKALWRESMYQRLSAWHACRPLVQLTSQLAPENIYDGMLHNSLVRLYSPSLHFPTPSNEDLVILSQNATESIECYRQTFREGKLRFYWRTVHNLFRSGVAVAYCYRTAQVSNPGLDFTRMREAINSCSTVLWGMVERYPPGQGYRNVFESLAKSILDPSNDPGQDQSGQEYASILDSISSDIEITDLSLPAMDALSWGFGQPSWDIYPLES